MIPKISVIIPIYNIEKYLRECLDSIANQTLDDIQVLMIDDGSTDSSAEICKEYEKKYDGFEYYYKENGGTASARNLGLSKATGEYIGFVDSDDYVELDMFQRFYDTAKKYNADIVYNCMRDLGDYVYMQPGCYELSQIKDYIFPVLLPHVISTGTFRTLDWGNCARIFKSSIIKDNNITFFDKSRRCEDFAFSVECALNCKRYVVLDEGNLYHYRPNENSKSRSYTKNMWKSIRELMLYMKKITLNTDVYDFSASIEYCVFYFCVSVLRNEMRCENKKQTIENMLVVMNDQLCIDAVLKVSPDKMNKEYSAIYEYMKNKDANGLNSYLKRLTFKKKRINPIVSKILNNKIINSLYSKVKRR